MNGKQILKLKMQDNDARASTVKEYLVELLATLWMEGEGFSGKRPFGNSAWKHELYHALVASEAIKGEIDEDGYLQDYDRKAGAQAIFDAIDEL